MPTLQESQFPPPSNWQELETLVWDLFKNIWNDPYALKNGRAGQPQSGVDIYGRPNEGITWYGVQVKGKELYFEGAVSKQELEAEIKKALTFRPRLSRFLLVTSAKRDSEIQATARAITDEHFKLGLFPVDVWGWEDIRDRLAEYPQILYRHYPDFFAPLVSSLTPSGDPDFHANLPDFADQALKKLVVQATKWSLSVPEDYVVPRDIPPMRPKLFARRQRLVDHLEGQFKNVTWVSLTGASGTGKTQLALSFWEASSANNRYWISFREAQERPELHLDKQLLRWHFDRTHNEKTYESYLSRDVNGQELASLLAPDLAKESLLVLDDLPDTLTNASLLGRLAALGASWQNAGGNILSTSQMKLRQDLFNAFEVSSSALTLARMETDEIRELLVGAAAPAHLMKEEFLDLLAGITKGHPILIAISIRSLSRNRWDISGNKFEELLSGQAFSQTQKETRHKVRYLVQNTESRQLLDRLSLISGPFTNEAVLAVSEVHPVISQPQELTADLVGPWIQEVPPDQFEVSPLLVGSGNEFLTTNELLRVHAALARAYLNRKTLSPSVALQASVHLLAAKEWTQLASLLLSAITQIRTPSHAIQMEWITWFFREKDSWPNEIALGARISIRAIQLKILIMLGRQYQDVDNDLEDLIGKAKPDDALFVFVARLGTGVLLDQAPPDVTALRAIQAGRAMGDIKDRTILNALPFQIETGFWGALPKIKTLEQINSLITLLSTLSTREMKAVFSSDASWDMALFLAEMCYAIEAQKPESLRDWANVMVILKELEKIGQMEGASPLRVGSVRAQAIVLSDYLKKYPEGLKVLDSIQPELTGPESFITDVTKASIHLSHGDADRAYDVFWQAIEKSNHGSYQFLWFDALRRGSVAAERTSHTEEAFRWLKIYLQTSKGKPEVDRFSWLETLGELGWYHWSVGSGKKAVACMFGIVSNLVTNPQIDHPRYREVFVKTGYVLGYISSVASTGKPPEKTSSGESYAAPFYGIFIEQRSHLGDLEITRDPSLLLWQLAMLSSGAKLARHSTLLFKRIVQLENTEELSVRGALADLERGPIEIHLGNIGEGLRSVVSGMRGAAGLKIHGGDSLNKKHTATKAWDLLDEREKTAIEDHNFFYFAMVPVFARILKIRASGLGYTDTVRHTKSSIQSVNELKQAPKWLGKLDELDWYCSTNPVSNEVPELIRKLSKENTQEFLFAAFFLSSSYRTNPRDLAGLQALMLCHLSQLEPILPKFTLNDLGYWIVRSWEHQLSQHAFLFSYPNLLRSEMATISDDSFGVHTAARILSICETATGTRFHQSLHDCLSKLASGYTHRRRGERV